MPPWHHSGSTQEGKLFPLAPSYSSFLSFGCQESAINGGRLVVTGKKLMTLKRRRAGIKKIKKWRDGGENGVESDLRWDGGLCFCSRPVISNQLLLTDSRGKFLGVNAACHSEGAGVSSWESGDEGRINGHSGGERWRESDGDPADGHTLSPSISHAPFYFWWTNVLHRFKSGVAKEGGNDGSFTLGVTSLSVDDSNLDLSSRRQIKSFSCIVKDLDLVSACRERTSQIFLTDQ